MTIEPLMEMCEVIAYCRDEGFRFKFAMKPGKTLPALDFLSFGNPADYGITIEMPSDTIHFESSNPDDMMRKAFAWVKERKFAARVS